MAKIQQSVSFDEGQHKQLQALAKGAERTFNEQVRFVVAQWLQLKQEGKLTDTLEAQNKAVTVKLLGDKKLRYFENADVTTAKERLIITRADRMVARYAIDGIEYWEGA